MNIGCDPYKIRVTLLNGVWFTATLGIQLSAWWKAVKADGYIAGGDVFVPYESIAMVSLERGAPTNEFNLMPPNAPTVGNA